jgi:hypothetical protein
VSAGGASAGGASDPGDRIARRPQEDDFAAWPAA